jgi:hypothetical protein
MRYVAIVAAAGLLAAACSSSSDTADPVTSVPDTGVPESPERCLEAPQPVLDHLATGLIIDNGSLPFGYAVQSNDYGGLIYMVAAEVHNDLDFDLEGDVATWAVRYANIAGDSVTGVASIDGDLSQVVSTWGEDLDIIVTQFSDGVRSARACVLEEQGLVGG